MAQQNNNAHKGKGKTFKQVMEGIWNWIVDAAYWCWDNVLQYILMVIVFGIIGILFFIIFYNWPVFILWCIFAPRTAAALLYEDEDKALIPLLSELMQQINGWIVALLPFHWKKYFMERRGVDNYSARLQRKYYFRFQRSEDTIKEMSDEGLKSLWLDRDYLNTQDVKNLLTIEKDRAVFASLSKRDQAEIYLRHRVPELLKIMSDEAIKEAYAHGDANDRSNIICAGRHIDIGSFKALDRSMVREYIRRNTPSDQMVFDMIEKKYLEELNFCAERYGMSSKVITTIKPEVLEQVKPALESFQQRNFITRHYLPKERTSDTEETLITTKLSKELLAFFRDAKCISPNAQSALHQWQYRLFHQAGHKMSHEVILGVLKADNIDWFKLILELDGDGLEFTEVETAVIMATPDLTDALNEYRRLRKEKADADEDEGLKSFRM